MSRKYHSFLQGIIQGLDLGNLAPRPHRRITKHRGRVQAMSQKDGCKQDREALASDWETIGRDFRKVFARYRPTPISGSEK